mgnify:CR=1 FL=1
MHTLKEFRLTRWRTIENTKDGCEDNFVYCDDCEDETTATFKIAGEEQ